MANAVRGEVALVSGGRRLTLCLTMGALAEIEAIMAGAPKGRLTAAGMLEVLAALLKGGGEAAAARDVAALAVRPAEAARAIAAAFAAAGDAP